MGDLVRRWVGAIQWLPTRPLFSLDRTEDCLKILLLIYIPALIASYSYMIGPKAGPDFAAYWAAGKLVWIDAAKSYDRSALAGLQDWFPSTKAQPFVNPPPLLFVVAPFGLLAFPAALIAWAVVTVSVFAFVFRRSIGLWTTLASPALLINVGIGQGGLLTGGLLIGAMTQLKQRPLLAGALAGCMVIKPQLALLLPVALIAGGYWRTILVAAATAAGLLALSYFAFGPATFAAFLKTVGQQTSVWRDARLLVLMQSPLAFVLHFTGNWLAAVAIQLSIALGAAVVVFATWLRRDLEIAAKAAVLLSASALATPYAYPHDEVLLLLPIVWLAREGRRLGYRAWEPWVVVAAFASPLLFTYIAPRTGLNLALFAHLALFAAVVRRALHPSVRRPMGTAPAALPA